MDFLFWWRGNFACLSRIKFVLKGEEMRRGHNCTRRVLFWQVGRTPLTLYWAVTCFIEPQKFFARSVRQCIEEIWRHTLAKSILVLRRVAVLASWSHSPLPLHALSLYWATKTIFSPSEKSSTEESVRPNRSRTFKLRMNVSSVQNTLIFILFSNSRLMKELEAHQQTIQSQTLLR